MKTKMKKISLGLVVLMAGVVFSSFIGKKSKKNVVPEINESEKYESVSAFVFKRVCDPIRAANPKNRGNVKSFSRCPSGYFPSMAEDVDDKKTDAFVYGTVELYKGCSPQYVCDFKVCVNKNYAMVKSKGSKEYTTVSEWISEQKRQQQKKEVVVKLL